MPKLSIITVNLNNRDGLAKTLASIHDNPSFSSFEHIVIDGGSTDGSVEIIRSYETRLAHWVSEPDRGLYHAMNKGIHVARGDFFLFLNSGDWLAEGALASVFADFPDADIVYGNLYLWRDDHLEGAWIPPEADKLDLHFFTIGSLPHPASFIKRHLLAGRGYSEDYPIISDRHFFFESYLRRDVRFAHLPIFVSYFAHGGLSSAPHNQPNRLQEVDRLLARYFRPQVLPFIQNQSMFHTLLRGRTTLLSQPTTGTPCLCYWNDLFFLLYRFRLTRACLHGFANLTRLWERRGVES